MTKTMTKTLLASLFACTGVVAGSANAATILLNPTSGDGDFASGQGNWFDLGDQDLYDNSAYDSGLGDTKTGGMTGRGWVTIDTGHTIVANETYDVSYRWTVRDRSDSDDRLEFVLFYLADTKTVYDGVFDSGRAGYAGETAANTLGDSVSFVPATGTTTNVFTSSSTTDLQFANNNGVGKKLYASFKIAGVFTPNDTSREQVRFDNVSLTVDVPEPGSLALMGIGALLIARRRRG